MTKLIPSGYDAMGKPVPKERMGAAYAHAKEMGLGTEGAMKVVGWMADAIERDDPYRALQDRSASFANQIVPLDLIGRYRLMAVLLAEPVDD